MGWAAWSFRLAPAAARLTVATHTPALRHSLAEGLFHRTVRLNELELLAFMVFTMDVSPAVGSVFAGVVDVGAHRRGAALLVGVDRHGPVRSHLRHAATRRLGLEIPDELVEIDVVAQVEAD